MKIKGLKRLIILTLATFALLGVLASCTFVPASEAGNSDGDTGYGEQNGNAPSIGGSDSSGGTANGGGSSGTPGASEGGSPGASSFTLASSYFSVISTSYEGEGNVRVAVLASVPYDEYTATVKLHRDDGSVITEKSFESSIASHTATTIEFILPIYLTDMDSLDYATVDINAASSVYPEGYIQKDLPRVTFFHGGELWAVYEVESGCYSAIPDSPYEENMIFGGWHTTYEGNATFDLSSAISADTSVYSRHVPDYEGIVNTVTTDIMKSVVTIRCSYYRSGSMIAAASSTSSGVIISEGTSSSLILTCCHCVAVPSGYSRVSITVEDYLGNSYSASVYQVDGERVIDPDYDLACVVASGMTGLSAIKFADGDAKLGDTVIALGTPGGQTNALTIGEVVDFATVSLGNADPNLSNVTFAVPVNVLFSGTYSAVISYLVASFAFFLQPTKATTDNFVQTKINIQPRIFFM